MMSSIEELKIRPYARLLTMLGEQLIKNERIALIELIKNSYDADADWAKVSLVNFGENYSINSDSKIVIEDNGNGMSADIIKKHWINPATPEKMLRKKINEKTEKGRVIQGEKGIGRFAIFKLGRNIKLITRAKDSNEECVVICNFSQYDDEFLEEQGKSKELFLEDLKVQMETRLPECIKKQDITLGAKKLSREPWGTIIEISDLKGNWSDNKIEAIYNDLARLESIFIEQLPNNGVKDIKIADNSVITEEINIIRKDFEVYIYKDSKIQVYSERYLEKLHNILDNRSVMKITNGQFDNINNQFIFTMNGKKEVLNLTDKELTGLKIFRNWLKKRNLKPEDIITECGPFLFGFYIFDFSLQAPAKYQLDKEDKEIIRNHRTYLYRDGIRVYPYGEPDDDWLRIDAYRGTISAGDFLSNDQVVGYINITRESNPKLKDKTNREGLIEEGNATDDFIKLIQIFLAYIRQRPYARYRRILRKKSSQDVFRGMKVQEDFEELHKAVENDNRILRLVSKTKRDYEAERNYLLRRAETTEDLAGVGLSVETTSHDIMAVMDKVLASIDNLIKDTMHQSNVDINILQDELHSLRGLLSFVDAQLRDIQLLFKSSKQRRRNIIVKEMLEKIERIYRNQLHEEGIDFDIELIGSPVVAKTTDAVLLQLFINLFDNSIYWLKFAPRKDKQILVRLDGQKGQMIFGDNGPGVIQEDAPYIFEAFYSGKGEEGRGLGLYIARQLLERHDYSIDLADLKSDMILSGANFVVNFVAEDS